MSDLIERLRTESQHREYNLLGEAATMLERMHEELDSMHKRVRDLEVDYRSLAQETSGLRDLLDEAYEQVRRVDHDFSCPRSRDDYECTCGLSDLKFRIKEAL